MFAGCMNCLIYSPKFWPFKKAGVEMLAAVSSLLCSEWLLGSRAQCFAKWI